MDKYGNKIIAVDFDKTLSMVRYPEVGEPNTRLFKYLIEEQKKGAKIILNSCRTGDVLKKAVIFCNDNGLIFDAINDNVDTMIETYGNNPRKISADMYIDDKAYKPLMDDEFIENINVIDALADQIQALLDLMAVSEDSVDMRSIKTASEMCLNMHIELMDEIKKIQKAWKKGIKE